MLIKYSFEKYETFVFYYNPESEIETFTKNFININAESLSIGHSVYDKNNGS